MICSVCNRAIFTIKTKWVEKSKSLVWGHSPFSVLFVNKWTFTYSNFQGNKEWKIVCSMLCAYLHMHLYAHLMPYIFKIWSFPRKKTRSFNVTLFMLLKLCFGNVSIILKLLLCRKTCFLEKKNVAEKLTQAPARVALTIGKMSTTTSEDLVAKCTLFADFRQLNLIHKKGSWSFFFKENNFWNSNS